MAEREGAEREPWYCTKVLTPGDGAYVHGTAPKEEKGEDLSSINTMLQQIQTQAIQGTSKPPKK